MGADIEERPADARRSRRGVRRAPAPTWSSARPRCTASTSIPPTSPPPSTRSRSCASPRRARARTTTIRGAGELRHKESDRVAGIAPGLRALGRRIDVDGDDLRIDGRRAAPGRRDRQPRRSPPGHDLRDRRARARRDDDHRASRLGGDLLSRLLRRPRKGASMTKRVVLIGHPVAHSLSGAMQQAAFDSLGIDATYELWDRAPIELADAIAELRTDDFLGANVTIPHKERVVPMVDRLTEEAHATGAVNTITREGKRLIGHNTDVPGFKVALDRLVGQAEDAAPGRGAGRRRRRPGRRLWTHHRGIPARHRVQSAPPSRGGPRQALRAERVAHGAARDALARVDHRVGARQDEGARQCDVDRPGRRTRVRSPRRSSTPTCWCSTSSTRRPGSCAMPPLPARRPCRRRAHAAPPGCGRVHAVDRPEGPARADAGEAGRGPRRRDPVRARASRPANRRAATAE